MVQTNQLFFALDLNRGVIAYGLSWFLMEILTTVVYKRNTYFKIYDVTKGLMYMYIMRQHYPPAPLLVEHIYSIQ